MNSLNSYFLIALLCMATALYSQINDIHSTETTEVIDEYSQWLDDKIAVAAENGNYKEAVLLQENLIAQKDSLLDIDKRAAIVELELRFEDSRQQSDMALATAKYASQVTKMDQQSLQQYIYMGGGIIMVIIVLGMLSRLSFLRKIQRELKEKGMKIAVEKMRAEESERVREQFLAKMSHEIRTPMNAIMGMSSILGKQKHYQSQEKYLNAILQSSENLLVILNDIMDMSRLEAGKIKIESVPFRPVNELMKLRDILKYKAEGKGISLQCELDNDIPEVLIGDPVRLSQVLINLTGNAIKFTEHGSVHVKIKLKERDGGKAVIEGKVIDTGIGIPEHRLEKIFESFIQAESDTSQKYGGTGLGLTISKEFIQLQNGKISVESQPGQGSIFTFEIPYKIGELSDMPNEVAETTTVPLKALKVLLVEDNDFNIMVAKDELAEIIEDVKIDIAANGLEALEYVKKKNYDIVLMDIEMELMNGYEAAREIRKLPAPKNKVSIIAITANAMIQEIQLCYDAGMDDHLSKPFTPKELRIKIQNLLFKRSTT